MFWGVILEPGKRYAQEVESPFHLTNAALNVHGDASKKSSPVSVMLEKEKSEYILCTLDHDKKFQKSLDLVFAEGEEITFFLNGDSTVHLTGYILPEDEFGDELAMSDDESDLSDVPEAVPAPGDLKRKMEVAASSNKKLKPGKDAVKVAAASPVQKADQKNKAEEKTKVEVSAKKEKPAKVKTPAEKKVAADSDEEEDDDDFSSEDEGVKSKYESLMKLGKFDDMTFDSEDDDDDDLDESMDDEEDESSEEEKVKGSQKQLKQALGKAGNTPKADNTPKGILKQPGSNKKPNQTPGQQNQNKKSPNQNQNQNQGQKKQFTPKGQGQGQQNHNKSNDFGKKSPFNQNQGQKKFGKQNTPNSAPFKASKKFQAKKFGSAKKF